MKPRAYTCVAWSATGPEEQLDAIADSVARARSQIRMMYADMHPEIGEEWVDTAVIRVSNH